MQGPRTRLAVAILTLTGVLRAQSPAALPVANPAARAHFEAGIASTRRGDLEGGLQEFEAAYRIQPHFTVLYNMGQAHATLGRPERAIAVFEQYLREGAEQVSEARAQQVRQLIAFNRRRLGQLRLVLVDPDRTSVWLDGATVSRAQLASPFLLKVGSHTLLYSVADGPPSALNVEVVTDRETTVTLEAPVAPPPPVAQLTVTCRVPGVVVEIGERRERTPLAQPMLLQPGLQRVRFSRRGYVPVEQTIELSSGSASSIDCQQRVEPQLAPGDRATLSVQTVPDDAEVFVDDVRFRGGPLPSGPHRVRVQRTGYETLALSLSVADGELRRLETDLRPTPETEAKRALSRSRRWRLGYILGGTSAALLAGAGSLYLWNDRRYRDWQNGAALSGAEELERGMSIRRVDDLSIGLAALALLGTVGTVITFSMDDGP